MVTKVNGAKTGSGTPAKPAIADPELEEDAIDDMLEDEEEEDEDNEIDDMLEDEGEEDEDLAEVVSAVASPAPNLQDIEESLNALKTLLNSVEKLQKVRHEVGDIKPLLVRLLDGEMLSGDELEQLKTGIGGLFRLVRAYSDHQSALTNAQPARSLLDQVLSRK